MYRRAWISIHWRRLILSVAIALCAGLTYALEKSRTEPKDGSLVVATEALETGEALVACSWPWTLPIRNPTSRAITITGWESSCGCAETKPTTVSIPAGETVSATLTLDLTTVHPEDAVLPIRPFRVTIYPLLDSGQHPGWRIHGLVRQPFAALPNRLSFGGADAVIARKRPAAKRIAIKTHGGVCRIAVTCEPRVGEVAVSQEGPDFTIEFTPDASLPGGNFEAGLIVSGFDHQWQPAGEIRVPVRGEVLPAVSVIPRSLEYTCAVAERVEQEVVLESRDGATFSITRINAGDVLTVARRSGGAQGRHVVVVFARASAVGVQKSALSFQACFADGTSEDLDVPVTIYASAIKVSP